MPFSELFDAHSEVNDMLSKEKSARFEKPRSRFEPVKRYSEEMKANSEPTSMIPSG